MLFINRQRESFQILLALAGLVFACFTAGLIVNHVIPRPTVVSWTTDSFARFQDLHESIVAGSSQTVRGRRRLILAETAAPVTTTPLSDAPFSAAPFSAAPFSVAPFSAAPAYVPSLAPVTGAPFPAPPITTFPVSAAPTTTAPTTKEPSQPAISSAPTSSPTRIVIEILPEPGPIPSNKGGGDGNSATKDTIPLIMVCLSSTIIICAGALYAQDVRERMRDKQSSNSVLENKSTSDINGGDTSAGSTSNEESGYWINTALIPMAAYPILPPIETTDSPLRDDVSISRMSTLTDTMAESTWSYSIEDKLKALDSSSQVTELSDEFLVSHSTALASLILCNSSDNSSLTGEEEEEKQELFGEELEAPYEALDSPRPSFDYTPDKEERDAPSEESHETDEDRMGPDANHDSEKDAPPMVIRDITLVPNAKKSIGLELSKTHDDSFPTIVGVDDSSPLAGRVFVGDVILALNGTMSGKHLTAQQTMAVLEGGVLVKMTIQSCESQVGSDTSTTSSTVDWSDLQDAVEV